MSLLNDIQSGQGHGEELPTMWIDPQACQGCVLCLKACSAKAIRVRDGVAHILPQLCVNCGDCFRACPHMAVRCRTTPLEHIRHFKHPVAAPSPTLFSQFGYRATPNQILLALERLGFQQVMDMGWLCEMNSAAMEEYLLAHPELRPGISASCPAVIRLIAGRFPSLLKNIIPILPPRVFTGKVVKERLAPRQGWDLKDVGVFHIAPCAAKMVGPHDPVVLDHPYVDGVISFREIYGPLLQALHGLEEEHTLQKCSGAGIAWAMSGGQAAAVDVEHTLDVAGFAEVVHILEMLEAGRLRDLRFLEAHICPDGCLGGPLVVENHFRARSVTLRQMRRYGAMSRVNRAKIKGMMDEHLFDWERPALPRPQPVLHHDTGQAIMKMKAIQALTTLLPGIECGVCGSPDCQTFAGDVIMGRAEEALCPFMDKRGGPSGRTSGREAVKVKDVVEALGLTVTAGAAGLERPVASGYISDLLSDVMANAKPGALWLTIQTHQNVVAVAVLKELAAVILVGGRQPAEETAAKAEQEGVPVLSSSEGAFGLAGKLHALGL
ncbi:MAG: [Fe-Fe] hydrogenase large subunit C-terminal domain-containing protein [Pseudomonadota bacterium]